jgi:hypothetical protein
MRSYGLVPLLEPSTWQGTLGDRNELAQMPCITTIIERNDRTGSGAFKATDASGGRWWVKPLNNPQGAKVPIAELIVGLVGALISAPVCEFRVVEIPEELRGEEYRAGHKLEPGYASASRDLGGCLEHRGFFNRDKDDNSSRLAGVFAIFDWCWGDDDQWLYVPTADYRVYSHDHGSYLAGDWTVPELLSRVDRPHPQPRSAEGLSAEALMQYAMQLRSVSREEIAGILRSVPSEWPVTSTELEAVGWFLERRTGPVASRLVQLAATTAEGGS